MGKTANKAREGPCRLIAPRGQKKKHQVTLLEGKGGRSVFTPLPEKCQSQATQRRGETGPVRGMEEQER